MLPPAAGGPWAGKAALESRGWKQPPPKTHRDPVGPPAGSVPPAAALRPGTAPEARPAAALPGLPGAGCWAGALRSAPFSCSFSACHLDAAVLLSPETCWFLLGRRLEENGMPV